MVISSVFIGVLFLFFLVNYFGNNLFFVIMKGNLLVSSVYFNYVFSIEIIKLIFISVDF